MSNDFTSQYFNFQQTASPKFLNEIREKIDFIPAAEIWRSAIYRDDKIGSLVYQGESEGRLAVLKIQLLEPTINEIDMIKAFNGQNKSSAIRLPEVYDGAKWQEQTGYGYLLMEFIKGKPIYEPPFATVGGLKKFLKFYEEYKIKALTKPFFPPSTNELNSLELTKTRLNNWIRIAESQDSLSVETKKALDKYYGIIDQELTRIKTEFMHAHLTTGDILETAPGKYVLLSNLFWSYRPEYYDVTFHLWSGIKSLRDLKAAARPVANYVEKWRQATSELSIIKTDKNFSKKFYLAMTERCIGALLVDISNQSYDKDKIRQAKHLTEVFYNLFEHCAAKI